VYRRTQRRDPACLTASGVRRGRFGVGHCEVLLEAIDAAFASVATESQLPETPPYERI